MLPFLVPVDSHTVERAPVLPTEPVPDAGAVWGKSSAFEILDPGEDPGASAGGDAEGADDEEARRGGVTITWPQERIDTVVSRDMTPVWRKYDVVAVPSEDDPSVTLEVAVTRQLLFPLGSSGVVRYVSGGSYVIDTAGRPYQERIVHSYLLLDMPDVLTGEKIVQRGLTEGEWPRYREELFAPGRFT